ncbi:MAG: hypothetical protein R3215_00345 [Halomonas sp.]|nr:hypothetical protein [Halomonas sp.]
MYQHEQTGEKLAHQPLQNRLGVSFPVGKPPIGWRQVTSGEPTPAELLEQKRGQVRQAARQAKEAPVTDSAGVTWAGGFDSALKIKAAADLAEFAGAATITLYDVDDVEHEVTLDQAKAIAALIGGTYQQKLGAQKAALRALKAIDLDAPDARERIEAVDFVDPTV